MPRYDFTCQGCGEHIELQLPVGERDSLVVCKKCNCPMLRQPSAPGMVFKGVGWTPKFHN